MAGRSSSSATSSWPTGRCSPRTAIAVVAPNPRGSSGRGFEFAKAIYADWGNKDVADVLAAVDHVVQMGVADPERLGVGGHSYGGILTNYVIASDPRFKAAISSAGAVRFPRHVRPRHVHPRVRVRARRALGEPRGSTSAELSRSCTPTASRRRRCSTAHELDFNVPCVGGEQMYQALRSLGVPTQLVIYPGESTLTVPSYVRDRLQRRPRVVRALPRRAAGRP